MLSTEYVRRGGRLENVVGCFQRKHESTIRRSYFEMGFLLEIIISIDSSCINALYYMSVMHTVPLQVLGWSRIARAPKSGIRARGETFLPIPVQNVIITVFQRILDPRLGLHDRAKASRQTQSCLVQTATLVCGSHNLIRREP
jgi:hypothetical protein